ncbi:MAG: septum site-determining protein MinD [Clostridia bacterium]|nr:septum site-determining protein MinD [Clostridia bacterium]
MSTAWIIASGKGGVGKSTITACLGAAMSREGRRVCIVDADIGLRDQDALLGLENRIVFDLLDVAGGSCRLDQALVMPDGEHRLTLLPASQFARAKELSPKDFRRILLELKERFDVVLIDCPAGIERSLRGLMNDAVDETILICTPDDICIRNAERTCGVMEKKGLPRPQVIVNRLSPELIRAGEMYTAATVAATLDIHLLGEIPEDAAVYRAALQHLSPMDVDCEARRALTRIAWRMLDEDVDAPLPGYGTEKLPWYRRIFQPALKEVKRIDR